MKFTCLPSVNSRQFTNFSIILHWSSPRKLLHFFHYSISPPSIAHFPSCQRSREKKIYFFHLLFIATINNFSYIFIAFRVCYTWLEGRHWGFSMGLLFFLLLLPLINNKILDWKMTLTAECVCVWIWYYEYSKDHKNILISHCFNVDADMWTEY